MLLYGFTIAVASGACLYSAHTISGRIAVWLSAWILATMVFVFVSRWVIGLRFKEFEKKEDFQKLHLTK